MLETLRGVAAESETTPATVAIAWLLARPEVTSVIIGASRIEQLEANLAACGPEARSQPARRVGRGKWHRPDLSPLVGHGDGRPS